MEFIVPKAIKQAMSIMKENGYESFIVGGSVRDFLMGKTVKNAKKRQSVKQKD